MGFVPCLRDEWIERGLWERFEWSWNVCVDCELILLSSFARAYMEQEIGDY